MTFNPHNHFWRADDGRLYSSALGHVVDDESDAYKVWIVEGYIWRPTETKRVEFEMPDLPDHMLEMADPIETWHYDPGAPEAIETHVPSEWPRDAAGQQTLASLQEMLTPYGLWASLELYAADVRWRAEVAGVQATVGGETVIVSTKREDRDGLRDTMTAILSGLRSDDAVFKFADGPHAATNDEMKAAIKAAFDHVQACFDREGEVLSKISAGTVIDQDGVDIVFEDLLPST